MNKKILMLLIFGIIIKMLFFCNILIAEAPSSKQSEDTYNRSIIITVEAPANQQEKINKELARDRNRVIILLLFSFFFMIFMVILTVVQKYRPDLLVETGIKIKDKKYNLTIKAHKAKSTFSIIINGKEYLPPRKLIEIFDRKLMHSYLIDNNEITFKIIAPIFFPTLRKYEIEIFLNGEKINEISL